MNTNVKNSFLGLSFLGVIVLFQNCGVNSFQANRSETSNAAGSLPLSSEGDDIASADPSSGNTYYVATNGSNDPDGGTLTRPWRTVSYAVSKMKAGDTTYVRGGVYRETGVSFGQSGTANARIRLLNYPREFPILLGDGSNNAGIEIARDKGFITIEGFEITNHKSGIDFNYHVHDLVIRRNWIHHNTPIPNAPEPYTHSGKRHANGILGVGARVIIDRNRINNNGNFHECSQNADHCNQDHAMYIHGSDFVITNNLIYGNLSYGIQIAGTYRDSNPAYDGAKNWVIANNTIAYQYYRTGIVFWGAVSNMRVENNILYENASALSSSEWQGIHFSYSSGSSGVTIRNNLSFASGSGGRAFISYGGPIVSEGVQYQQSGNIVNVASPLFVNAPAALTGSPDFSLTSSSPARNTGLVKSEARFDFFGNARRSDAYDIGAIKF